MPHSPTAAEWKVLKIVADAGSAASREVAAECERRFGWSVSTTKTMLRRLADKGHLKTRRVGNSFLYRPSRSILRTLLRTADELLDHAAAGTVAPLIAHMVRRSRLSKEELAELRALLDAEEER
jgi:predicted transcriptional regulator